MHQCFSGKNRNKNFVCFPAGMKLEMPIMFKFRDVCDHIQLCRQLRWGPYFVQTTLKLQSFLAEMPRASGGFAPGPPPGASPGPHRGPKAGPWTPPVMGFAPRRSPYTLYVHQIFSQFLYNFGRATFKSWLTPCPSLSIARKKLTCQNKHLRSGLGRIWMYSIHGFKSKMADVP